MEKVEDCRDRGLVWGCDGEVEGAYFEGYKLVIDASYICDSHAIAKDLVEGGKIHLANRGLWVGEFKKLGSRCAKVLCFVFDKGTHVDACHGADSYASRAHTAKLYQLGD